MIVKRIHVNRSISIVPMRIAICGFRIGALAVRSHNLALIVWRPGMVAATAGKLSAGPILLRESSGNFWAGSN